MLVGELRAAVADDDIAIGEPVGIGTLHRGGADRCLLSGVIQTSHFNGVRTVFGTKRTSSDVRSVVANGRKADIAVASAEV